jgi:hypothetical protein
MTRKTAAEKVKAIIDSLPNKKAGFFWRDHCKSDTAFIRTWPLGRAGRKLAMAASEDKKTKAKGEDRLVVARHALIALEKLARQVKTAGGQLIYEFLHFVLMLGTWAARAVSGVIEMPHTGRKRWQARPPQMELNLSIFAA